MNNVWYWKIRGVINKLIFIVKKSVFYYHKWNRQRKDFQPLKTMLFINIIKNIINSTFYVEKEHILEYNKNQLKTVNILKCTRPLLFLNLHRL